MSVLIIFLKIIPRLLKVEAIALIAMHKYR
jgi:hypothetical protein